ncbi:MAG: UPF0175 family protein [Anaerolineae bacterium]|nr:UPF0175 family protein [Anaerolineae bacterium]
MMLLEIKVPDDLPGLLRLSQDELEREVQVWIALELFRDRKVSAGKAAEIAHVPLVEFMRLTQRQGIPWVAYTTDELEREVQEAISIGHVARSNER